MINNVLYAQPIARLNDLPYGAVIRRYKRLYVKSKGVDGDIMTDVADGMWHFIAGGYEGGWQTVDWKTFDILFLPP